MNASGLSLPQLNLFNLLIHLLVLITAIPLHELAHAFVADRLGDDTPRRNGRLTFHPMAHLDLYGSIALMAFGFGWGKSVPVNPAHFRHPKRDMALASLAGPVANVFTALFVMILSKPVLAMLPQYRYYGASSMIVLILEQVIYVNLYLAVFNLIPVPPLDGAGILSAFLPRRATAFFSEHVYKFYIVLVILLITGLLQIPILLVAGKLYQALEWISSPLNALFG